MKEDMLPIVATLTLYWDTEEKKYYATAHVEGTVKRIVLVEEK